ncbi:hypothetical protein KUD11_00365 [Roseovarius sp. LXJ103]|uniref:hypothetical protein n=1 Tax=Roseovarius carneus TaxID=2853164 RepID=UPI000D607F62|nr:hypothetical protein [Roseovarius carneus]MBZ8117094.1 hypothetical protein [Roseovarius carneus]PWE37060.1 hypothetical protein DD563_14560 [Pelagicola sp. LXJ1103]
MRSLEDLGRVRLSKHFFMRDFLYSEIGNIHCLQNVPENPDIAIKNGRGLCENLLDPLEETFGRIAIRSAYRSPDLNRFGNENGLNCARNEANYGHHIWDMGGPEVQGACASIAIPWFADRYAEGRDWRDLAWWIHDHLPYSEMWFFPKLAALNLTWRVRPQRTISSYIAPKGKLLVAGAEPSEKQAERRARYADFPPFRGIAYP